MYQIKNLQVEPGTQGCECVVQSLKSNKLIIAQILSKKPSRKLPSNVKQEIAELAEPACTV